MARATRRYTCNALSKHVVHAMCTPCTTCMYGSHMTYACHDDYLLYNPLCQSQAPLIDADRVGRAARPLLITVCRVWVTLMARWTLAGKRDSVC